jgi:hypothetical protein
MIWTRQEFNGPAQVGWHSGHWSIYAATDDGPCVLSSGAPMNFGPEHYVSVGGAFSRAEEIETKEADLG